MLGEILLIGLADNNFHNLIGRVIVDVADQSELFTYHRWYFISWVGAVQKVWLQLCKLLYQLTESCSIQEEGLQIKVAAHQPLLPSLEKMLAALLTIDDPTQYNQVSPLLCVVLEY